jgi:hypothetical protein
MKIESHKSTNSLKYTICVVAHIPQNPQQSIRLRVLWVDDLNEG